ncbi:hypothetical protein IRX47_004895 [Salmonella enterica]|nr:hypothetical protein [Salmonella enterica]
MLQTVMMPLKMNGSLPEKRDGHGDVLVCMGAVFPCVLHNKAVNIMTYFVNGGV